MLVVKDIAWSCGKLLCAILIFEADEFLITCILSEQKKEDRGVIISTAELEKYFGKEVTPAKMKEQIMSLLDDWKEKQPPELAKAPKKQELDK